MRYLPLLALLACGGSKDESEVTDDPDTDVHGTDPTDDTDTTTPVTTDPNIVGSNALKFEGSVPKNVIFLSIDTTRKDHIGPHSTLNLSPFFDQLATESVVLDDHMQCSNWTWASTTCTLAGRYNIDRGHIPRLNGNTENKVPVPAGTPFLATWLAEQGYYSVLVSANDWLGNSWGNAQGYNEVLRPGGAALAVYETGTGVISDAISRGEADDGWFMHLHFMEPHASYNPPVEFLEDVPGLNPWPYDDLTNRDNHYGYRGDWPTMTPSEQEFLEAHLRRLYEGEIRTLDSRFSELWGALETEGWLDDTLVVVWNDHGEAFWEHGKQTHAYQLYGEENDGFAFFWAKNIVPGTYTKPTASIDLVPTILDLLEIPMPPEVTGYPVGEAPADRARFAEVVARSGGVQSVVKDGYKLHFSWVDGKMTFHDRNVDPNETNDIYSPTDPKVVELWSLLKPMSEKMADAIIGGVPAPNYPPELP